MALRSFPHFSLYVFLFISYLIIKDLNRNPADLFPQAKKLPSLINQGQDIVGRFRCLKGWKQFGGSCYHPSIMKSTPGQANQTCSLLHVNNTHLMRIRHSAELSYGAHLFFAKNLTTLLVETDPRLFKSKMFMDMVSTNDRAEWKVIEDKLYQIRLESKPKRKFSALTNKATKSDQIYSSDEDNDAFERFNDIRGLCDQFAWNIFNNDSHIFTLTTYKIWDRLVCSLSDVDLNSTYEYVCQYVLDFCFGNLICGKHGQCVNSLEGFKCSCSFFFNGVVCETFARKVLEMLIAAIIIIILSLLLLIIKIFDYRRSGLNRAKAASKDRKNGQRTTSDSRTSGEPLKKRLKSKSFIRSILIGILTFTLFCLLLVIPAVFQVLSFPSHDIDSLKSQSVIDEAVSMLKKCERKSFISMEDRIFFGVSMILTIIFLLLAIITKQNPTEGNPSPEHKTEDFQLKKNASPRTKQRRNSIPLEPRNEKSENQEDHPMLPPQSSNQRNQPSPNTTVTHSVFPYNDPKLSFGLLSPIGLNDKINRAETAAILGILTFEILKVFDEILLAISGTSSDGVVTILLKRTIVVFLIGFRYYPMLISLRFRNIVIRLLAFGYMLGIITYTIYRESLCLDFLPHSENFSMKNEVQLRIQLSTGFIIYGLIANLPHFALLSYIAAEFGVRLMFDLYYGYEKNNETEYLPKPRPETQPPDANPIDDRSSFQKCLDRIYRWDREFSYSTMVISTYTVNFIILFHLTCTISFLYTTRTMSPISFLTNILQQMLNIEIKDRVFHIEIILCAIITGLIYGFQLLSAMDNFRKHINKYRTKERKMLVEDTGINEEQARSKAMQYPGYLIRYTMGGFIITFHLSIFIAIVLHLLPHHYYAFKWIIELLLPIFILYALQSLLARGGSRLLIDTRNQTESEVTNTAERPSARNTTPVRQSQWRDNLKNILQYFILVANCFIGIASSIIRLIMGLLFNLVYMNRIDCCLYRESLEECDRANMAYWCFVYEEVFFTQGEQSGAQAPDRTEPSGDSEKPIDDTPSGSQPGEGYSVDTSTDNDSISFEPIPEILEELNQRKTSSRKKALSTAGISHSLKEKQLFLLRNWNNIIKRNCPRKELNSFTATQQLDALRLKKFRVSGDGNCFFRAISHQLHENEDQHSNLRSKTVKYLSSNMNDFAPFIDPCMPSRIEDYVERMRHDGTYVDHRAVLAAAVVINRNIIVHERGKTPLFIPGCESFTHQLHVWYDPHSEHYDSVVCSNGSLPLLSKEQVLET